MLKQVWDIAKKYDLSELKLSVEKRNVAFIRTIQKNGSIYSHGFCYEKEEAYCVKNKKDEQEVITSHSSFSAP